MRKLLLCTVLGCSSAPPPDIQPLVSSVAAAVVVGQTASLAMQAMASSSTCATVKTACTSFPCQGAVTITYGGSCQLPLGDDVRGTVEVTGVWQSADAATLTSTVIDVAAGTRSLVVVEAANLDVSRTALGFDVHYTGQDVRFRDGLSGLDPQSSWRVSGGQNDTPSDPSNDDYFISESAAGASSQVLTSDVPVLSSCRRNPTGGMATLHTGSTLTQMRFHQECDGQAVVGGQLVGLDFLR